MEHRPRFNDAVIVIPGLMGSVLQGADGDVLWGRSPVGIAGRALLRPGRLGRLSLSPTDGNEPEPVTAAGIVQTSVVLPGLGSLEGYGPLIRRIKDCALDPAAVAEFAYDWRKTVASNAALLTGFAAKHLNSWRDHPDAHGDPRLRLVCHSMGGLVAEAFAETPTGADLVREVITLGTPFGGASKTVIAFAHSDAPLPWLRATTRDITRTFPGVYDLIPSGEPVVVPGGHTRALEPDDIESTGGKRTLTVEAFERRQQFNELIANGRTANYRTLTGTHQHTISTLSFDNGTVTPRFETGALDRRGDGTVPNLSASPQGIPRQFLPQSHGALTRSPEALAMVESLLTDTELGRPLGTGGVGIDAPELAEPGMIPVQLDATNEPTVSVEELFDDRPARQQRLTARRTEDGWTAAFPAPRPGLFRINAQSGGYSPTTALVLVEPNQPDH